MLELFRDHPGRYFLLATLLPLGASALLFLVALIRSMVRKQVAEPGKIPDWGGPVVLFAMTSAAVFSLYGLALYSKDLTSLGDNSALIESRWSERVVWVHFGSSKAAKPVEFGYRIDRLTALTVSMVTVVGTLIVLFSIGYLKDESRPTVEDHAIHYRRRGRFGRFFAYLGLFAFAMLNLLIADNLFQVFISWELVGVCSFFLIGFYTERPSASTAANKAFIVNRIGDAGFLMALFIAWTEYGTFNIESLNSHFTRQSFAINTHWVSFFFGIGLLMGAIGKSAQVPLQTWLPDAMEGPTPVSALIHAATMVAAGVYLVGRCFPMFLPNILFLIAFIGAITAFISATTALVQHDIKRVLAFSTCSQLGFMMVALGIGAWTAGLLHLLTHAFFKALLFLSAGSVIHACHHEQDLRKMGGLRKKLPITAWTMFIGVLAISGAPFFSGWYSKDQIVAAIFENASRDGLNILNALVFVLPIATVPLTAYYMFRLWLMAFAGEPRDRHVFDHAHESPAVMTIPLLALAALSVGIAWGWPFWNPEASALGHVLHDGEPFVVSRYEKYGKVSSVSHELVGFVALGLSVVGAGVALALHKRGSFIAERSSTPLRRLFEHRWYFDEAYDRLFVRTTKDAAFAVARIDKSKLDVGTTTARYDGTSLDGWLAASASFFASIGTGLKLANRGRPRAYVLVLGLTAVVTLGILSRFLK
jgi:proton-translocating NADH-quinone oxidoreductase chain L